MHARNQTSHKIRKRILHVFRCFQMSYIALKYSFNRSRFSMICAADCSMPIDTAFCSLSWELDHCFDTFSNVLQKLYRTRRKKKKKEQMHNIFGTLEFIIIRKFRKKTRCDSVHFLLLLFSHIFILMETWQCFVRSYFVCHVHTKDIEALKLAVQMPNSAHTQKNRSWPINRSCVSSYCLLRIVWYSSLARRQVETHCIWCGAIPLVLLHTMTHETEYLTSRLPFR